MKLLFISDIHGISTNLKYIEEKIEFYNIDKLVCLGDLYYTGPTYTKKYEINSKEVHEFLSKYKDILICMKGNCDSLVDIKSSDFPISDGISLLHVDGLDIYITHGNEYSYEKDNKLNRKGILVYGHEHVPFIKQKNEMIFINPGSISLPRNDIASYLIYDNKKFTIYDINSNIIDMIEL